ncbi:MAG TPA: GYD domain-containing protein [Miltoncostaeaceae bacterium]|jgi:uncharacterized protein with GYD domain|nr:GYD domain-containing protein [Miltoncostaeaceae bacterium]
MPTYVTFFTYTADAWARMVDDPPNRAEAAAEAIAGAGGELIAFYWMLGNDDGFAVYEMPDEIAAAGLAAAVARTGRLERSRTFQVLDMDAGRRAVERARELARAYRPPGAPADWCAEYDRLG